MTKPRFATVILDVDSTVSGIEGIDWLAVRRGNAVGREVRALTDRAMNGEIPLDEVYGARLDVVRPSRADIGELAKAYIGAIEPGCVEAVHALRDAAVVVKLVSGGLRPAILPLADHLAIAAEHVHAVDVYFDSAGAYAGFESTSPMSTAAGKRTLVEALRLGRPVLAMGDGSTDLAMRPAVDRFVCFAGFVRREQVAAHTDAVIDTFDQLLELVIPTSK